MTIILIHRKRLLNIYMQAGLSHIDIENFWGDSLSQKARSTHETRGFGIQVHQPTLIKVIR